VEHSDLLVRWNLLNFQPRAKKFVSLLFHEGASIPGEHPHLEGAGTHTRTMRIPPDGDAGCLPGELAGVVGPGRYEGWGLAAA